MREGQYAAVPSRIRQERSLRAIPTLHIRFFRPPAAVTGDDLTRIRSVVANTRGLVRALAFTPVATSADQPFAADGRGPALALQLDFAGEADLDAAACGTGPLAELVSGDALPGLAKARADAQRMIGRRFPTPDPKFRVSAGAAPCTFLVDYPGRAADLEAWLDHYDAHHPAIMARFPGVREVATFRPAIGARNDLPCAPANSMQRNKVAFDSVAALEAALASPVMAEMRADFGGLSRVHAARDAFCHGDLRSSRLRGSRCKPLLRERGSECAADASSRLASASSIRRGRRAPLLTPVAAVF